MKEYEVKTFSGTIWKSIKSYTLTNREDIFMKFIFDDNTELLLPVNDIKSIQQIN